VNDVVGESLCFALSDQAERARWHVEDIPWTRLDPARATTELRALVREAAFSELTTTSATKRFLDDFADDTDFTQWVSVWFFEETRHPQVLLRWLHCLDVRVDDQFLKRGRATAPFMKSRFGTLTANIISELVASAAYAGIHATIDEPVLAAITKNLAGDEARHAASFFAYAQRHLARSRDADADRRDALKVAYLWFQDTVRHPVSEFITRVGGTTPGMNVDELRGRVLSVIGSLVGVPLDAETDLRAVLAKKELR
jgi:hypothetical protein